MKKEKAIFYAGVINKNTDFIARADIDYLSKSWYVQILGDKYYTSNKIENSVIWELATKAVKIDKPIKIYAVYINGDNDGEFTTLKDAKSYIKDYIRGTAETYNKTQKYIRENTEIKIEVVEY